MNQWVEILDHLGMFCGHWSSGSGDKKYLICHVTSQNQVIEGSRNFIDGSSSMYVTNLPNLVATGIVIVEMFLVCHVILTDYVIKGSFSVWIERLSKVCHQHVKVGGHRHCVSLDIRPLFLILCSVSSGRIFRIMNKKYAFLTTILKFWNDK